VLLSALIVVLAVDAIRSGTLAIAPSKNVEIEADIQPEGEALVKQLESSATRPDVPGQVRSSEHAVIPSAAGASASSFIEVPEGSDLIGYSSLPYTATSPPPLPSRLGNGEPATLLLLGIGLAVAARHLKRRHA
jgi:hypothetical protein